VTWLDRPHRRIQAFGRLRRPWWVMRFAAFGRRSILHRPRFVQGARAIAIGADVYILHDAWLSAEPHTWGGPSPALVIGDRVKIRTAATIVAAESVVIEDDVVIGGNVTIIDCDHVQGEEGDVTGTPLVSAPIRIGRGTWLSDGVRVLRGSDIGERCVIGANSVVRGAIPDRSVAAGSPARVVGRVSAGPPRPADSP